MSSIEPKGAIESVNNCPFSNPNPESHAQLHLLVPAEEVVGRQQDAVARATAISIAMYLEVSTMYLQHFIMLWSVLRK